MGDTVAVDMFVVATATFRLLYTVIVLGHDRRRIIHFDVTQNPTQVWLARQITEASRGLRHLGSCCEIGIGHMARFFAISFV
jgi:hypothetical protein